MEGGVESLVLQRLNDVENLIVGLAAGVCTQIIVQPFIYYKAAVQIRSKEMPFTLNPRIIYRGTAAACCNFGVLTGIQFQFSGVS